MAYYIILDDLVRS